MKDLIEAAEDNKVFLTKAVLVTFLLIFADIFKCQHKLLINIILWYNYIDFMVLGIGRIILFIWEITKGEKL